MNWSHACEDELERLGYETVLGRAGYPVTAAQLEIRVEGEAAEGARALHREILQHHGSKHAREGEARQRATRGLFRKTVGFAMVASLALAYACT